ncbi:MAG TPA: methyltransferase domain-containing protein, partial [Vicinamibacterales bacterium]
YYPTYLAKLRWVRQYLSALPSQTRVLDAGCGEGVLVEEFAERLAIEGVDEHYSSPHVRQGSILALPYAAASFDRVLCLDVLEHLPLADQPRALGELRRVLRDDGELLISVPNLAHLQSRLHFLLRGTLIRTASETKHPGDRPVTEYLQLARQAGFEVVARHGIFPTVPLVTRWIRTRPKERLWAHRLLTAIIPVPGLCFLNLIRLRPARRSGLGPTTG